MELYSCTALLTKGICFSLAPNAALQYFSGGALSGSLGGFSQILVEKFVPVGVEVEVGGHFKRWDVGVFL